MNRTRSGPLRLAIGGALLQATAAVAAAQELPRLETVVVVGKHAQPLVEAPASVSVITAGELQDAVAFDARDALTREPGLSVARDPHRFGLAPVTIRGLGGNRVLLETDGVPVASGFAVGSYSDSGRSFADLELIRRIEVLKGPASALYGSDAIAGVIATTTVDPADLLQHGQQRALRVRSGWASDDHSGFAAATLAARTGAADLMLALARREGGELQHPYETLDANPREQRSTAAMLRAVLTGFAAPLRLTVGWDRQAARSDVDSLELSGGRFANTVRMEGDDRADQLRLLVDQQFDGVGPFDQAAWRVYLQDSSVLQRTDEERRAAPPRAPALGIQREFHYNETVAGGELTLLRRQESAAGPHLWVGGIEFSRSRIRERRDGLQTTLATGAATKTILGEQLPVRDFPVSVVTEAGLYLQDEWRPRDGRWSLIPALRADWYRLDPRIDAVYAADNPSQQPVSIDSFSLSPKLGIGLRASEATTAWLQYSHGFRAQPFEDVNIGLDLPLFNVRAIPNPALRPERSDSIELGLRIGGDALSGGASAWYSRYEDFIESRVNIGRDPATGTTLFQSRNIAAAEIYGAEASIALDLGRLVAGLDGLSGRASLAWAEGRDRRSGLPINSVDPLRGRLELAWMARSGTWSARLALTAVDGVGRVDESRGALYRPGGYATLDLTGHWQLRPWLRLTAGLFNLADRRYVEWADVRGRAPGDPLLELYRQPGRHLALTLTASL